MEWLRGSAPIISNYGGILSLFLLLSIIPSYYWIKKKQGKVTESQTFNLVGFLFVSSVTVIITYIAQEEYGYQLGTLFVIGTIFLYVLFWCQYLLD